MIVVPPFVDGPNYVPFPGDQTENNANCIRMLKELGRIAARYDMRLSFELVGFPRSSVRTIADAKAIVEAVNLPNVGYVFDAYNIYLYQGQNDFEPMRTVQREKIFAIHLNSADDVPERERRQEKRCFVNKGVVDIDKFFNVLSQIGYEGMCSIETFRPDHWAEKPEKVVDEAYQTTLAAMKRCGCL